MVLLTVQDTDLDMVPVLEGLKTTDMFQAKHLVARIIMHPGMDLEEMSNLEVTLG